jgi:hypothetical protein
VPPAAGRARAFFCSLEEIIEKNQKSTEQDAIVAHLFN